MQMKCILSQILAASAFMMIWAGRLASAATPLDFDIRHAQDMAKNPTGLDFTLRLLDGKTQFHIGEVIPLEATFVSHDAKKYQINVGGGISAPWSNGDFVIDRDADTTNPMAMDYCLGKIFSVPGDAFEYRDLDAKPQTTRYILNAWRRFDKPGVYRIYLRSTRVQPRKPLDVPMVIRDSPAEASNILQIEILPDDPAWSAQMLANTLPAFQIEKRNLTEGYEAAQTLRFLDTPASIKTIIDHYAAFTLMDSWNSPWYSDGRLGLLESRRTASAAAGMAAKIEDPNFPIAPFFIKDLAQLQTIAACSHPNAPLATSQTEVRRRIAMQDSFLQQDLKRLREALPQKRGDAAFRSAFTLFDNSSGYLNSQQTRASVAPILVSHFEMLMREEQMRLLDDNCWPALRTPRLLPALRNLYRQMRVNPHEGTGYNMIDHRSQVLRRLYELSPAEGRQAILAEMTQPFPQVTVEVLGSLPDPTLPNQSRKLASLFQGDSDWNTISALIARYGTREILPSVSATYQAHRREWECPTRAALLAYFLRVAPEYGAREVKTELQQRQDSCCETILSDTAELYPTQSHQMPPALQQIAIATLSDLDRNIAGNAAKALGAYGSLTAKPALWRRLRQLHAQGAKPIADGSLAIVAAAIATAPAWLTDHAALQQLQSFFPKPDALQQAGVWSVDRGDQIHLQVSSITSDGQHESWQVSQYMITSRPQLKRKLAQYPHGTVFTLTKESNTSDPAVVQKAMADLRVFLTQHGMRLRDGK